jgi:SAM-dependent methyltransferase
VERLRAIQWHFASHRILTVASRTGILHRLAEAPASVDRIAADLGLDPLATGKMVRALSAMGLVQATGDTYTFEPDLVRLFQPGFRDYGPMLEHSHELYERWGATLEQWVRTGSMPPRERTPEGVRDFAEAMWASANILGPDVAAALDLAGVRQALDLGGGTGRLAVALCRVAPDLRVTVLDQPDVVALGPDAVASTGVGDRIAFVPGDYLSGDLGSGFDLVLLSNVLHQERAEAAAAMVRRAAATLVPGGRLAIVDFTIDDHQRQVESGCLFAVNMRSFGDTWPEPVLRRWMRDAGLIEVTRADLGPTRWLMEGRRA